MSRQDQFGQTCGLKALAVETGLKCQLTGDGLALIGLGAQSSDFGAVLVSLIAVGVEGSRAGARLPRLGLHHSGRGGEGDQQDENAKGDHETEDGPFTAVLQAWPSAGQGEGPDAGPFNGVVLKLAGGRHDVFG